MVSLVLKQVGTHSVHPQSYGAQESTVFIGLIIIFELKKDDGKYGKYLIYPQYHPSDKINYVYQQICRKTSIVF